VPSVGRNGVHVIKSVDGVRVIAPDIRVPEKLDGVDVTSCETVQRTVHARTYYAYFGLADGRRVSAVTRNDGRRWDVLCTAAESSGAGAT